MGTSRQTTLNIFRGVIKQRLTYSLESRKLPRSPVMQFYNTNLMLRSNFQMSPGDFIKSLTPVVTNGTGRFFVLIFVTGSHFNRAPRRKSSFKMTLNDIKVSNDHPLIRRQPFEQMSPDGALVAAGQ